MKEERNIKVTLEQAIVWHNSDNKALKKLATVAILIILVTLMQDVVL